MKRKTELHFVRGIPYLCATCGGVQIHSGSGRVGNCDREKCQGDDVSECGPRQTVTIIIYQDSGIYDEERGIRREKPHKPTINQHPDYERAKNVCPKCHGSNTRHNSGSREYEVTLKCTDCGEIFTLTHAATVEIERTGRLHGLPSKAIPKNPE